MSDTDAPVGRTYITRKEWVHKNPTSPACRFPDDYTIKATTHVVPNGKWVMERDYGCTRLIGIERDELEEVEFIDPEDTGMVPRRTLLVSDKPFGFVSVCDHSRPSYESAPAMPLRMRLYCARQVHKGELGQTVPIPRLPYVRQAFEPGKKPMVHKARERKRSNLGWVRLSDLCYAAQLTPRDLIFGYWRYSGHLNYRYLEKDQDGGQLLDIVVAASSADIRREVPTVVSATQHEAASLICESVEDIWVRRGFAYTVLRLLALGVRPEVKQPV